MQELELSCVGCGAVRVAVACVEVHENPGDGFRLLTVPCPRCGDLLATATAALIDTALCGGATRRVLRCPAAPFTAEDAGRLRRLLDDDAWCARLLTEPR